MMTKYSFSFSHDTDLIKSTVLLSNNINYCFDDTDNPDTCVVPIDSKLKYIKVEEKGIFLGFFLLKERNDRVAEAHLAFLPRAYGRVADLGRECLLWIWEKTTYEVIICPVLEDNKLALNCILRMGFTFYGHQGHAWLKYGKWHDFLWLMASKQDGNNIDREWNV